MYKKKTNHSIFSIFNFIVSHQLFLYIGFLGIGLKCIHDPKIIFPI